MVTVIIDKKEVYRARDAKAARTWCRSQGLSVRDAINTGSSYVFTRQTKTFQATVAPSFAPSFIPRTQPQVSTNQYGWMRDLVLKIAKEEGVTGPVRVRFTNSKSYNWKYDHRGHIVTFGFGAISGNAQGYYEYPTVQYCWGRDPITFTGDRAAKAMAIHEAAHMVVWARGYKRESHGEIFQNVLMELIAKYF